MCNAENYKKFELAGYAEILKISTLSGKITDISVIWKVTKNQRCPGKILKNMCPVFFIQITALSRKKNSIVWRSAKKSALSRI